MKTVIDAVNEFKGVWHTENKYLCNDESKSHWFFTDDKVVRSFHGCYHLVCTTQEFKKCVEEMSNIDPSLHSACCPNCNHEWQCAAYKVETMACPECFDKPEPRVKPSKPIYTQAMSNHKIKPLVGMECLATYTDWRSSPEKVVIECVIPNWVWVSFPDKNVEDDFYCVSIPLSKVKFKPIQTDEDKAVKDMVEHLTNEGIVTYDNIMLKILIEKFKGGKIHGVTFKGES